jgi:DNA-binding PadR family transcriptional regulator
MSRANADLTTTSHAILGLLATRAWTTYELARHMERSLGPLWPRAQSKIYEEPKKLVALGLARATAGRVGRRPRTVYTITPKGRRTLHAWLAEPAQPPALEHEPLLKIFFAEHGERANVLDRIEEMRRWALERRAEHWAVASAYRNGEGAFQERAAHLLLTGGFLFEFSEMTLRWADWANDIVKHWPNDVSKAVPEWRAYDEIIHRAENA